MPKTLLQQIKGVLSHLPFTRLTFSLDGWPSVSSRVRVFKARATEDAVFVARSGEVERRQLSVLFCDLIASTKLSRELDPEDFHEVLNEYHRVADETITRHGGYTAQFLGDGVLAYFGFPTAHEDDPQRAVRAALALTVAADALSRRLQPKVQHDLQVRVGIHTGVVVLGAGDSTRGERLAVGEVPNIASKAQQAAPANGVVVTAATRNMLRGQFEFAELAPGSSQFELFVVQRESTARTRLEWSDSLTEFVGREREREWLATMWRRAKTGESVAAVVIGEPGSGKSRLVREFCESAAASQIAECTCSARLAHSPFYPLIDVIARRVGIDGTQSLDERRGLLGSWLVANRESLARAMPVLSALMFSSGPLADGAETSAIKLRRTAFEVLYSTLLPAGRGPQILVIDDIQWADPSTLEFLTSVLQRKNTSGVLVLITSRPDFQSDVFEQSNVSVTKLSSLDAEQSRRMIGALTERLPIQRELVSFLVERSNGLPLYIEELTRHLLDTGMLVKTQAGYQLKGSLSDISVPSSIQGFLTEKLDRLGYNRMLVQAAAVFGLVFDGALLAELVGEQPAVVDRALQGIARTAVVLKVGSGRYAFRHALIREAAYQMLSRERRREYHRRAAVLIPQTREYSAREQPEVLAYHYTGAGDSTKAAEFWLLAGTHAIERYALLEAMDAFQKGLARAADLAPSLERDALEAELLTGLGFTYSATKGFSATEVEDIYTRARKLCANTTNPPLRVLFGMWGVYLVRGDIEATATLAEHFRAIVRDGRSGADERLIAHACLGTLHFYLGELRPSTEHFEAGMALCDLDNPREQNARLMSAHGFDGLLYCHLYMLWNVMGLDQPDRLHALIVQSQQLASRIGSPFAAAMTSMYLACLGRELGDVTLARAHAQKTVELAQEYGYSFWLAGGMCVVGWIALEEGELERGLQQIQQGIALYDRSGARVAKPYYLSYLADAYLRADRADDADRVADEALQIVQTSIGRNYTPWILQWKGRIARKCGRDDEAAKYLEFARELAKSQGVAFPGQ